MDKPFLLIAGDSLYPRSGTKNWIGCYKTVEEIKEKIKEEEHFATSNRGKEEYIFSTCEIDGQRYDWYCIVDLRDWVNK